MPATATFHAYKANTVMGVFNVAVAASSGSRFDAISAAQAELGGRSVRVHQDPTTLKSLPAEAFESSAAAGWAWMWRA
jgi:hypothetical protein